MQHVAIAGAGLAGTLLAILLARRGYEVDVYERRPDPRQERLDLGRSINLALSARGSRALAEAALLNRVLERAVPMRARAIHSPAGEVSYQAFGRTADEYLSAIERNTLVEVLLDAAESEDGIGLHFNQRVVGVDLSTPALAFQDQTTNETRQRSCQRLVGADGAFSAVRRAMVDAGMAQFVTSELDHGYKELPIGTQQAQDMRLECLHLWPRRSFSMIANPNPDRSFSCTLFMAHEGDTLSFAKVKRPDEVEELFRSHFPDALARMPELGSDFLSRPTGTIPSVTGGPWHAEDKVVLVGDAAHALVPFFAQGMNSAFEDCSVLTQCLDLCGDRWDRALPAFFAARKANTDAIADMAMQNYREIQVSIADQAFLMRKRVEQELMRRYPEVYTSMHVLVMFTTEPYVLAKACGELQGRLLDRICGGLTGIEQIHWPTVEALLGEYAGDVRLRREALPASQTMGAA
jgi:kynurenine 3-monooxygenase